MHPLKTALADEMAKLGISKVPVSNLPPTILIDVLGDPITETNGPSKVVAQRYEHPVICTLVPAPVTEIAFADGIPVENVQFANCMMPAPIETLGFVSKQTPVQTPPVNPLAVDMVDS